MFSFIFLLYLLPKINSNECSPHCISCADETYCYDCESGYYVDDDEGYRIVCTPCHGSCKECSSHESHYCTECRDGFYLKKSSIYGYCERCPTDNCKNCSNSNQECTQCLSGFYFTDDKECKPCDSSCEECSGPESKQCTKCPEGSDDYTPSETEHYCRSCDPHCLVCENTEKCSKCKKGFYVTEEGKCSQCHASCNGCTGGSNSDCLECNEHYFLSGEQCRECDSNCKTCSNIRENCTSCEDGFYVDSENQTCKKCDDNCKVCKGPGQCRTCNDGFLVNTNGLCVTCGERMHCKTCQYVSGTSGNTECLECADGAYPSRVNQDNTVVCSTCPETCTTCYDKDFCTSCIPRYFLYRDKCEKCAEGCRYCENTASYCTECLSGYRLSDNKCVKCPDGCSECQSDQICTSCSTGFYLDGTSCLKCDPSCKSCNDNTNACIECNPGYAFDALKRCAKCPANCTLCTSDGCYDCDPEFYLLPDGSCAPCATVCFECTGPTENDCIECDPGFYIDHKLKQCIECHDACKTCTGPLDSDCLDCAKGYWHTTRMDFIDYTEIPICGPCEYQCAECTDDEICTVCNDGFRLYGEEADCEACERGCKRCVDAVDKCTECLSGYYPTPKEGKYVTCSSCPSHCDKCTDDGSGNLICNNCMDGYYQGDDGRCIRCTSPCATCSSSTRCTSCIAGHLFDGVGSCDSKCSPECQTCDRTQTTCLSCHNGYYLIKNSCIKCPMEGCKDCVIGDTDSTCRECLDGFFMDLYFDYGNCYPCHEACATCDEMLPSFCFSCSPGYYEKESRPPYITCESCSNAGSHCADCKKEGSNLVCTKCEDGYSLVDGECILCHNSCKTCDGPLDTDCVACSDNFYLNNQQMCVQCSSSCANCEGSATTCTSCKEHYYVKDGRCLQCHSSCLNCSGTSNYCTSCPDGKHPFEGRCYNTCEEIGPGYGTDSNNTCIKCDIYQCKEYGQSCKCQKCNQGFMLVSDSVTKVEICMACAVDHCNECTGLENADCQSCQDGYLMNIDKKTGYKTCLPCIANCKECTDQETCLTCNEGYFLENSKCKSCPLHCQVCSSESACTTCYKGFIVVDNLCKAKSEIPPVPVCQESGHCLIGENDYKDAITLIINSSTFSEIKDQENGGAIMLINHPTEIKDSTIKNCESTNSGGGIYIKIDKLMEDPVSIVGTKFIGCSANYGGGVYMYSDKDDNMMRIFSCLFESNRARILKGQDGNAFYGGSAVYLQVKNGTVNNCIYRNNYGNVIRVNSDFSTSSLLLESSKSSSIVISDCLFEQNTLESKSSSLFFVQGKDGEMPIEVKNCIFNDVLPNGSHYIDGIFLHKNMKKNSYSKLRIMSCKFSSDKEAAVNANSFGMILSNNSHQFNYMQKDGSVSNKKDSLSSIATVIVLAVSCIAILAALVVFNMKKNDSHDNENISELRQKEQ